MLNGNVMLATFFLYGYNMLTIYCAQTCCCTVLVQNLIPLKEQDYLQ